MNATLIGMALHGVGRGTAWRPSVAIAACVASTFLLLAGMQLSLDDRIIVALTAPVVFCWSMLAKTKSEGVLASSPLVFAGEVSFALYLAHMPILVAYKGVAAELRGTDSGFVMTPTELASLFIVTLFVSVALHLFVERPGRNEIRKRFETRSFKTIATLD